MSVLRSHTWTDRKQQKAADRRRKHPNLPFNPQNPYDFPLLPMPPLTDDAAVSTASMPSVPTPERPAIRRHLRQESAEEIERRQREEHILQLKEMLAKSQQREKDLERQLEREVGGHKKQFA